MGRRREQLLGTAVAAVSATMCVEVALLAVVACFITVYTLSLSQAMCNVPDRMRR